MQSYLYDPPLFTASYYMSFFVSNNWLALVELVRVQAVLTLTTRFSGSKTALGRQEATILWLRFSGEQDSTWRQEATILWLRFSGEQDSTWRQEATLL